MGRLLIAWIVWHVLMLLVIGLILAWTLPYPDRQCDLNCNTNVLISCCGVLELVVVATLARARRLTRRYEKGG